MSTPTVTYAIAVAATFKTAANAMTTIADMIAVATSATIHTTVMSDVMTICATEATIPVRTTLNIETAMMIEAAVTTTIAVVNRGMTIIVIPYAIITIDGEEPTVVQPRERTEEVVGGSEDGVLPVVQDMTQVGIAVSQIVAIDIISCLDPQEVVKVDLVAVVVLLVVQVQFISHLIREETGLFASLFVAHG